jgi:hypothetical protein
MLEYTTLFGGANRCGFSVTTTVINDSSGNPTDLRSIDTVSRTDPTPNLGMLYYSMRLFFQNGGGSCYIVSIGEYGQAPAKTDFTAGLTALAKEDEPTLIVLTDATNLDSADYYSVCEAALQQCKDLGDRFTILDVQSADTIATFRNSISSNDLSYGAAYYPYLHTALSYEYDEAMVTISPAIAASSATATTWTWNSGPNGITVTYIGTAASPKVAIVEVKDKDETPAFTWSKGTLTIKLGTSKNTGHDVINAAKNSLPKGFIIGKAGTGMTYWRPQRRPICSRPRRRQQHRLPVITRDKPARSRASKHRTPPSTTRCGRSWFSSGWSCRPVRRSPGSTRVSIAIAGSGRRLLT